MNDESSLWFVDTASSVARVTPKIDPLDREKAAGGTSVTRFFKFGHLQRCKRFGSKHKFQIFQNFVEYENNFK